VEGYTATRKIRRTNGGRALVIREASPDQEKKTAEAYIWILQNFMPEFGEIKRGEKQSRGVVR